MIDGENIFVQPVQNDLRTNDSIQKTTCQNNWLSIKLQLF